MRSSPDPEEAAQGEREARLMRWGLVPRWAKDLKVGYRMINAKSESLLESRAYAPLVGKFRHRCLIVADGFYEWMKAEDPKQPRQPWRFTVDDGEPFAFAGLCTRKEWEDERTAARRRLALQRTIITTTPNEVVARVHDRMPVILPGPEAEAAWLDPDLGAEDAVAMCEPLDGAADAERPGQPEAEQGRQGDRGGRSCWSPRPGALRLFGDRFGASSISAAVGADGRSRRRSWSGCRRCRAAGIAVVFQTTIEAAAPALRFGGPGGRNHFQRSRPTW